METQHGMLFLKLDCGRSVYLDAFDYGRTYAGLFEGRPNGEINAMIIAELTKQKYPSAPRKIHLIPPEVDNHDSEHPVLPEVCLRAELVCFEPIDQAFMASDLVVVWFDDECHTEPIEDVVFRAVRGLPWKDLARDFDW